VLIIVGPGTPLIRPGFAVSMAANFGSGQAADGHWRGWAEGVAVQIILRPSEGARVVAGPRAVARASRRRQAEIAGDGAGFSGTVQRALKRAAGQ